MSYHTTLERCRLALGTAKVLGAPAKGNPASSDEAKALGEALAHLLPAPARLEAHCLAAELVELADAERDQGALRLKLRYPHRHGRIEEPVWEVGCLMAGFWDVTDGRWLNADWRNFENFGVSVSATATTITIPKAWTWTGRQFVYD